VTFFGHGGVNENAIHDLVKSIGSCDSSRWKCTKNDRRPRRRLGGTEKILCLW